MADAIISGLASGIALILVFSFFTVKPAFLTEPTITQQQAIEIAKQDIASNYFKNLNSFRVSNTTKNHVSAFVPVSAFNVSGLQVPLIYVLPNGTALGIDLKTNTVISCASQHRTLIVCVQPTNTDMLNRTKEKLVWILDLAAGCKTPHSDAEFNAYEFYYAVDAQSGQILWRGVPAIATPVTC